MNVFSFIVYEFGFLLLQGFLFGLVVFWGLSLKKQKVKQLLFAVSAIPVALLAFELLGQVNTEKQVVSFSGTNVNNVAVSGFKEFYGYGPKVDTSFFVSAIRKNNDSLIYNVKYSFTNGGRSIPNNNDSSKWVVSFVGGSNVFGDGVNDDQTLPYYLNYYSGKKYSINNYAFSGYGAHQVYTAFHRDVIPSVQSCDTNILVYLFIPEHINRAAGKASWDKNGPLYEIENKTVVNKGSFFENMPVKSNALLNRFLIIFRNSYFYDNIWQDFYSIKNTKRVYALMKDVEHKAKSYDIRFVMVIFNYGQKNNQIINKHLLNPLHGLGVEMYYVDSIIPDFELNGKYTIQGDNHPNANFNQKIAKFLHKKISVDVFN